MQAESRLNHPWSFCLTWILRDHPWETSQECEGSISFLFQRYQASWGHNRLRLPAAVMTLCFPEVERQCGNPQALFLEQDACS